MEEKMNCDAWGGGNMPDYHTYDSEGYMKNDPGVARLNPKLFWLVLVENTETGDSVVEHIDDVEESEVKYAAARLVTLAQARGIEVYSIEVATGVQS